METTAFPHLPALGEGSWTNFVGLIAKSRNHSGLGEVMIYHDDRQPSNKFRVIWNIPDEGESFEFNGDAADALRVFDYAIGWMP